MNTEGVETKQITIYSESSPLAIQLDDGLTIHVDQNKNAMLYFNKGDRPIVAVKTLSGDTMIRNKSTLLLVSLGLFVGAAFWWLKGGSLGTPLGTRSNCLSGAPSDSQ